MGHTEKKMFSFLFLQCLALRNSYPESFLCFSSGDETCSPLLPSALLHPGSAEGVSGTTASQRAAQQGCTSDAGMQGRLGLRCGTSHLPSSAWQSPGNLHYSDAFPSYCLLLCFILGSFCTEEHKMGEVREITS